MQEICPYCGGAEFAMKMRDGPEEMIWCASCFRVWFRDGESPDPPVPAATPPAMPPPPTKA